MPHLAEWDLVYPRNDLSRARLRPRAGDPLRDGQIRLSVEKFALTANNATYARLGDSELPFWEAFPAPTGYGRIPVWGTVSVAESRHPAIAVGERFFGYVPMSSHHVVEVPQSTEDGFFDLTPQRADFMHPWYRTYRRAWEVDDLDDHRTVLRPLFTAAFTVANLIAAHVADGGRTVVVTSASSKTAITVATQLVGLVGLRLVGVTASHRVGFVAGLDVFDTVVGYDAVDTIQADGKPVLVVDIAGDIKHLGAIHAHFGGAVRDSALVGYTHPSAVIDPPELTPQPRIFFSPHQEEMQREVDDGYEGRARRVERATVDAVARWLKVRRFKGPKAMAEAFRAVLAGELGPDEAVVCTRK
ncbi:Bll1370 protein [Alloactinosynnema sp. L-07]|uniref:DUF2855 family protein n=1 Tax=Alloactinosynnema sp. L-07 TaxID=1653480 RepID=UPI00065EF951|nr:DUF2855 family protein [Alloactinosynnema sp. L-07]CRK59442.1 Bll1370 protein [Alloactinosynnema sp. L-07]